MNELDEAAGGSVILAVVQAGNLECRQQQTLARLTSLVSARHLYTLFLIISVLALHTISSHYARSTRKIFNNPGEL